MSHRNHRRAEVASIRPPQDGRLRYMDAADAACEDHSGKAISRAQWKRITNRTLRRAAAQAVSSGDPNAPARPLTRSTQLNSFAPRDLVRPLGEGRANVLPEEEKEEP